VSAVVVLLACRCRKSDGNTTVTFVGPVSDMPDVEQSGELRVEIQFGGGTGQFDIHLHRTERVEGISFFVLYVKGYSVVQTRRPKGPRER